MDYELVDIEKSLRELPAYCLDKREFDHFELDKLVLSQIMQISNPEQEEVYMVSTDMFETVGNAIVSIFGKTEKEKQEKLYNEGKENIKRNIIQGQELFNMSKSLCSEEIQKYNSTRKKLQNLAIKIKEQLHLTYRSVALRHDTLNRKALPHKVALVARKYGLDKLYSKIDKFEYNHKIDTQLDQMSNYVDDLLFDMENSDKKLDRLIARETLQDTLSLYITQLSIF
jgi:predicted RNase H-like nuclease (RuvC/YqgF family)